MGRVSRHHQYTKSLYEGAVKSIKKVWTVINTMLMVGLVKSSFVKFQAVLKLLCSVHVLDTPLKPWIAAEILGTILCVHCNCMAGLGEACSHIAALLFAVEKHILNFLTVLMAACK